MVPVFTELTAQCFNQLRSTAECDDTRLLLHWVHQIDNFRVCRYPAVPRISQDAGTRTPASSAHSHPTAVPECLAPKIGCPRIPRSPSGRKEAFAVSGVCPGPRWTYATSAVVKGHGEGQGLAAEKQHQDTADAGGGCCPEFMPGLLPAQSARPRLLRTAVGCADV
ncbi:hypothetical protein CapIbe_011214 [Capra ibex]